MKQLKIYQLAVGGGGGVICIQAVKACMLQHKASSHKVAASGWILHVRLKPIILQGILTQFKYSG
jgi:hypothetical protein